MGSDQHFAMERKALERLEPGLPAAWYYDPAHYGRELEAFWYGQWIAVAREEELAAPGDWRVVRIGTRIVAEVRANWKLLAENFSECFHCPPVHPELCRVVSAYREAGAWGLRGAESAVEYAPGAKTLTLDGTARLPPIATLGDEERRALYVPAMLPPALF